MCCRPAKIVMTMLYGKNRCMCVAVCLNESGLYDTGGLDKDQALQQNLACQAVSC